MHKRNGECLIKYYIGIDGGSTKTTFAVGTEDGKLLKTITRTGCSYQSIGVEASIRMLEKEINTILESMNMKRNDCLGCCIGMPCYGENPEIDQMIEKKLKNVLFPMPIYIVNDVEVGWAGSLECQEGIHIAAGSGSIAFGRGKNQKSMRCGGWNEFYGDDGSCYWIGRKAMNLFSKEADGRVPKGALYEIVRRKLGIMNDFYFTDIIREDWAPYRWKVAAFQFYAYEAYQAGDTLVGNLYQEAAHELALMVRSIREKLSFTSDIIDVSYSGGLFQVGDLILKPFQKEVEELGCILKIPAHSAIEGALLLAKKHFSENNTDEKVRSL